MALSKAELDNIDELFGEHVIDDLNGKLDAAGNWVKGKREEFQEQFKKELNSLSEKPKEKSDLLKVKNDVLQFRTDLLIPVISKLSIINDDNVRKELKKLIDKLNLVEVKTLTFEQLKKDVETLIAKLQSNAALAEASVKKEIAEAVREFCLFITGNNFNPAEYDQIKQKVEDVNGMLELAKDNSIWKVTDKASEALLIKINELKSKELEIRNRVQTYGEQIAYTLDNTAKEIEEEINGELSNLKTDYIVWKSQLTNDLKNVVADASKQKDLLLAELSTMPEVAEAQAYIDSVNKLVKEEIPLKIKYAQKFIDDQRNELEVNFEKNVSKVFAEVAKDSQELLNGKIRQISDEMGGLVNPELATEYLTFLKDPKKIKAELKNRLPHGTVDQVEDIVLLGKQASEAYDKFRKLKPKDVFKGLEAKILGAVDLKDILGVDFKLPNTTVKDNKLIYHFVTDDLEKRDLGEVTFYNQSSKNGNQTQLVVYFERDLTSSDYRSLTQIKDFGIGVWDDSLLVVFNRFEVEYKKGKKKTKVEIAKVGFNGALNFVGQLAEKIKMGGNGLDVNYNSNSVDVRYNFALPSIKSPSFNLANLRFGTGLNVPFASEDTINALETTFAINSPDNKFLVTVGMFGGRGHFVVKTTPNELTYLDAALEFGGYYGLNLGIAKGYAYLFAGLRYKIEKQPSGKVVGLYAYLICSAGVTVFGFISVSVTFRMQLVYRKASKGEILYGTASVRYSVKVGFFKKSFTLRYKKTFKSKGGMSADPETTAMQYYEQEYLYASSDADLLYPTYTAQETLDADDQFKQKEMDKPSESISKVFKKKEWDVFLDSYGEFNID